jgi:hypothetical protein
MNNSLASYNIIMKEISIRQSLFSEIFSNHENKNLFTDSNTYAHNTQSLDVRRYLWLFQQFNAVLAISLPMLVI